MGVTRKRDVVLTQSIVTVPIRPIWRYLVSITRYSDLLVENREIFITNLYLAPPQGVTPSEFREEV